MHHSIHDEAHLSNRNHWLRAAVLGANDGLISTASLLVGVAAASTSSQTLLLTGMAALTAGALSMAAGEYISVWGSRQRRIDPPGLTFYKSNCWLFCIEYYSV